MATLVNTTVETALDIPSGTTGQRPPSPTQGMIRYNTDLSEIEYYDGVRWCPISESNPEGTGGTIIDTEIGGSPYRVHIFDSVGISTLSFSKGGVVDYLIVAGGGGGGYGNSNEGGGGGGAGGVVTGSVYASATSYSIVVGDGGASGANTSSRGANGSNSTAFGLTALGGGGGGSCSTTSGDGGSGGGGSGCSFDHPPGAATQPGSASGGFGNTGGYGRWVSNSPGSGNGGGGGGAGSVGINGEWEILDIIGRNGTGIVSNITGQNVVYATGGPGGPGGPGTTYNPQAAVNGLGNGGGGGTNATGVKGGSGVVIVRYRRNETSTTTTPSETIPSTMPGTYYKDTRSTTVRTGLVGEWDAANPLSYPGTGNTWYDLSGYGNHGTNSNMTFTTTNGTTETYINGGFDFNNSSSVCIIPNSASLDGPTVGLTIEAWAQFDADSDDFIFEKGNVNTQFSLFSHGSDIVFRTYHQPESNYDTQSPSKATCGVSNGQPYHIVGSWDGVTKRIYINGELKHSQNKSGELYHRGTAAAIGRFGGTTTGYYFGGYIWMVRVYEIGLTEEQIKQNFNATRGRFGL